MSKELDRLEALHAAEELREAKRSLLDTPRPEDTRRPTGGALPASLAWHERYYGGERCVRGEKKPPAFDHLRSRGPWMVSVDDEPLSVLDGMSQTATLPEGFAPDAAVRAYVEGELEDAVLTSSDTTLGDDRHALAYAETLRSLVPGLPTVSFVNSGAEANEKAYALCLANAPKERKRLLAFEGSFHGRTMLALYASFNPKKRVPFQIPGYEVEFASAPIGTDGADPDRWVELWGTGDADAALAAWGESEEDDLAAECKALHDVATRLTREEHFAVVIEPMQSEGGDRYVSARFQRGLRLLTRARDVSLIVDEVQCGFGLSGPFLWHQRFDYVTASGEPDHPDCVCFAKRAQVGVCMSRFSDPEPTHAFPASLARGRLHALSIGDGADARRIVGLVQPRLDALFAKWSHRIRDPRTTGYAIAFDLADTAEMMAYLGQRFWRGAVVFGAGSRTIRYRLNASWDQRAVDLLFASMNDSLAWLDANPGEKPPTWEEHADAPLRTPPEDVTIRIADPSEVDTLIPKIMAVEKKAYEPARQDSEPHLRKGFSEGGVAAIAERNGQFVGSALGAPLELVRDESGPDIDPMLDKNNTLYSLAVTVHPDHHGAGIGRALKVALLRGARALGRYRHATGRNRVPDAASMQRLNDSLGAYTVERLENQYEGDGVARYYRQPLGPFVPDPVALVGDPVALVGETAPPTCDLASGLARPFRDPPASLRTLYEAGGLFGPTVTKITVLNYLTPAVTRAVEWVAALTPRLPHLYLCSSRDETVDKAVRCLKYHRKEAEVVITFDGAYVGHTTACARSISDPATHRQGAPYFEWPRVPHPAVDADKSLAKIKETITSVGAERVIGIVIEAVQERTGRVVPDDFYDALNALRDETGVPVVLVENASASYRSGNGPFAMSARSFAPDVMTWWSGGQLGFVHVNTAYRVAAPFVLVSTWDGDELSLIQAHHQLRAARAIDIGASSAKLDEALNGAFNGAFNGLESRGLGLYRVIDAGSDADALVATLAQADIRVRAFPNGCVVIAPALDTCLTDATKLLGTLS